MSRFKCAGRQAIFTSVVIASWCLPIVEARAAETVLEGGAARACYEAASFNASSTAAVSACTNALAPGTLTKEDRSATLINRGILKARLSDFTGALEDYDAGLALQPGLADAYIDRGAIFFAMKKFPQAIAELSKGLSLGPQYPNIAFFDRGLAREHIGDFSGACSDYQEALNAQPNFEAAKRQVDICRYLKNRKPTVPEPR